MNDGGPDCRRRDVPRTGLMMRFSTPFTPCTNAGISLQKSHFVPLFETTDATYMGQGTLANTLQHYEIGHDPCSAGPSQNGVGLVHRKSHINVR